MGRRDAEYYQRQYGYLLGQAAGTLNRHGKGQTILAFLAAAGMLDDATVIGVVDNPVAYGSFAGLLGLVFKLKLDGATWKQTFLKLAIALPPGAMMVDDATIAGLADNPVAGVVLGGLVLTGMYDWWKDRRNGR